MKRRTPPARVSQRPRKAELAEAIATSLAGEVGTDRRTFQPDEPSTTDGASGYFRGVKVTDWEALERKDTERRALTILQSHPWYCKCGGCQSFAPKAVQPVFFTEKYDPLAA